VPGVDEHDERQAKDIEQARTSHDMGCKESRER
jgi:hypothetical protein